MLRALAGLLLLFGSFDIGPVWAASPDEIAALMTAAQGRFPASRLPTMCVAVHQVTAAPEQTIDLLRKLGARCVRSDNDWGSIEKPGEAGLYHWEVIDPFWSALCRAGIKPVMIIGYNNPLYAQDRFRPIAGAIDIRAYQNFAVANANHYAPLCPGMAEELFNEPSASNWTTVPWSGASYAAMLAPVSAAIKTAQPHVTVYSGGIGLDPKAPSDWITQMVQAARLPSVDAYGLHPYYDEPEVTTAPLPEQLLIDSSRFAHDAASSGQAKPIAITEYGIPSQQVADDAVKQAFYVARGMLTSIIGQYPLHTHYDLVDDGTDKSDHQNAFGLFRNGHDQAPYEIKLSGIAFAAIAHAMADAKTVQVSFDAPISAPTIAFEKPRGQTLVIWTYDARGAKSYGHEIGSFRRVSCQDVLGKAYPCQYSAQKLMLTLAEARGPVVVTAEK